MLTAERPVSAVEALLPAALRLRRLSDLSGFLESVAQHFEAQGVILWRQEGDGNALHVLSQYPRDTRPAKDGPVRKPLDIDNSLTGLAVRKALTYTADISDCAENVTSFFDDPRTNKTFSFIDGIRAMCVVPIRFEDGAGGALNLYRTLTQEPFSDAEFSKAKTLGKVMPGVYQTVLERLTFAIVGDVSRILGGLPKEADGEELDETSSEEPEQTPLNDRYQWPEEDVKVIRRLCRGLKKHLDCFEVAVFLNHPEAPRDVYLEVANTWASPRNRQYRARIDEGLTGYVLAREAEVLVDDLQTFDQELSRYRNKYPDIVWRDGNRIMQQIRVMLGLSEDAPLQPLSYMGVPIIGKRLYGVIRCSVALSHPYYFSTRELALLRIVAAQLARFWSGWLEQRTWLDIVRNVSELNRDIEKQLSNANYNVKRIDDETLKRISAVVPEASTLDVRMYNPAIKSLEFVAKRGTAWQSGTEEEREVRARKTFAVAGRSFGAQVFRTGEPGYKKIVAGTIDPDYDPTFSDSKELYTIPVRSADKTIGVLDARSNNEPFARHTEAALLLFARQLGLYHYLVTTLSDLKVAEKKQRAMIRDREQARQRQSQVYKDLQHQFRSPIWVAHRRAAILVRQMGGDDKAPRTLVSIRGLCSRAERVVYSTRMFVDLADEREIEKSVSFFTGQDLIDKLEQAAADHQLVPEPDFDIAFRVLTQSFRGAIRSLQMDGALFEQALSNVLDNAGKYSAPHTQVRIEGGFTKGSKLFYVAITNFGIPIKAAEIEKVLEREYQGEAAKAVSSSGSGIGLWIANHIMRAHGGHVEVRPTSANGATEIRLVFGNSYFEAAG